MWGNKASAIHSLWTQRHAVQRAIPYYNFRGLSFLAERGSRKFNVREGEEIIGFEIQQISDVPEFNLTAVNLIHKDTGVQYVHLYRDDTNNAFCVGFRTTPTDSTGLPHILEHTTLCGSGRFPCRDPFFRMLDRSLATFMNALTGPDYTMYPFATQNPYDFRNLMAVYLDAVFSPRLREIDFRQEGWRLEHEDINDPNSPIIFKGVVFNEMKGVFADPQVTFSQALLNNILPSHTYGHISGGDPLKIPLLTHEDLKAFHKKFYIPSNAKFYSYGNFSLCDNLTYVSQNYLVRYEGKKLPSRSLTMVPPEKRWTTPRQKHIICRSDPLATNPYKQSTIAVSMLLDDICNVERVFEWNVLSELLVSGPNSAFYKSLVENQIGAGFTPSTGFEAHTRDTYFSVGLQGVSAEDFDTIVEIFDKTVDNIIEKGFPTSQIEAVLHGIELNMKHEVPNFGLGVIFSLAPLWNHDGDIVQAMKVNDQLKTFRRKLRLNPDYFQELVECKLKDNTHKLILTMTPDEDYEEWCSMKEAELLESMIKKLPLDKKQEIFVKGQDLQKEQSRVQNITCLPTLEVEDLNQELENTELKDIVIEGVPIQTTSQPTNGLVYFRGILNVSHLTEEQRLLLPLFASIVTKMGTEKSDYRELDQRINMKTGGISFSPHLRDNLADLSSYEVGLLFSSYAMDRNVDDMFNIISEIFNQLKIEDVKRFETLTRISATNLANSIIDQGHQYAMLSAGSFVNGSASSKESYSGVSLVDRMRCIAQSEDLSQVMNHLRDIAAKLFSKCHLRCAVNYSGSSESNVLKATENFLHSLSGSVVDPCIMSPLPGIEHRHNAVHHVLPIPVNFAAKAVQTVAYTHQDYAPLAVLARLLSTKYLHPVVREKGGAYGSGALTTMSGLFSFYSYRDPNSCVTFDAFDGSSKWIRETKISYQDIEEAKLGVFQKVDAPVPPGQKGLDRFIFGLSDTLVQQHRKRLMSVTKDNLYAVTSIYLSGHEGITGRALLGPANKELSGVRKRERWCVKSHDE